MSVDSSRDERPRGRLRLIFIAVTNTTEDREQQYLDVARICAEQTVLNLRQYRTELPAEFVLEEPRGMGTNRNSERIEAQLFVSPALGSNLELWMIAAKLGQLAAAHLADAAQRVQSTVEFRTSVAFMDRIFLDPGALRGADEAIRIDECYFGNVVEHNRFRCHFIVEQDVRNGWFGTADVMKFYYGPHEEKVTGMEERPIFIDFEHDRRRLIILFPIKHYEKKNETFIPSVIRLEIEYKTIRRTFVDFVDPKDDATAMNLYLHVACPPKTFLQKFEMKNESGESRKIPQEELRATTGDRYRQWIPLPEDIKIISDVAESCYVRLELPHADLHTYMHILCRLAAAGQQIEIRRITPHQPHVYSNHYCESPTKDQFFTGHLRYRDSRGRLTMDFAAIYMIEALLSRGTHVKDQLLTNREWLDTFKQQVISAYGEGRDICIQALETLLARCDERADMDPITHLFPECVEDARARLSNPPVPRDDYILLRKVTITPTRLIFDAPEFIMSNRVIREGEKNNYSTEDFLRVSFRDEDMRRIESTAGKAFIQRFIHPRLIRGVNVAGKTFIYLGSSNSQMRDQGCYLMAATDEQIRIFRAALGSFELKSVPKLMARFGQCFTQSLTTGKKLKRDEYVFEGDFLGGFQHIPDTEPDPDEELKSYIFSDGVGAMSYEFAREVARTMKTGDCVPSCCQFRFRGLKGVLAVDPRLDLLLQFGRAKGLKPVMLRRGKRVDFDPKRKQIVFRNSQNKFSARSDDADFEIVKLSGPSLVCFNKPFINILDQVSAKQSYLCHQRVTTRIFELLDVQLRGMAQTMTDERAARNRIGEFPQLIMFRLLQSLNLTNEPFFHSLLSTAARCTLKKLRTKLQIAIPPDLGRSLLGIIDETGLLGHGQIFVRYTVNSQQKRPGPGAMRNVVTGPVLVSKNPMIVPGDVRMFEAVDIPALRHLCDVIVFPRHGYRPHTDEMAGSDLDGDEYSVIWDPALYLETNEEPWVYLSATTRKPEEVNETGLRQQMSKFFTDYISNDSIGTLATAHLVNADLYGIYGDICNAVAKKHMTAVDFPKSGIPGEKLTSEEKPSRKPDFGESPFAPSYISPRLNGRLYRRIKRLDELLDRAVVEKLDTPVRPDEGFHIDGADVYTPMANELFNLYKSDIDDLLRRFGIGSEAELFSNSFSVIRKRLSDKEDDDVSFFNTQRVIEDELHKLYAKSRRRCFERLDLVFEEVTEWPMKTSKESESWHRVVLKSVCHLPPEKLQKLSVACYRVAYSQRNRRHLSFGWLLTDVLYNVRLKHLHRQFDEKRRLAEASGRQISAPSPFEFSFNPLGDRLSKHIDEYCQRRAPIMQRFVKRLTEKYGPDEAEASKLIVAYCKRHKGLQEVLFMAYRWAERHSAVTKLRPVRQQDAEDVEAPVAEPYYSRLEFLLTFIQFGLNHIGNADTVVPFLEETEIGVQYADRVDLRAQYGGLGKRFLQFIECMASLSFARMTEHSFVALRLNKVFRGEEWHSLHQIAESSYYKLTLADDLTVMPLTSAQRDLLQPSENDKAAAVGAAAFAVDGESFIIELPHNAGENAHLNGFVPEMHGLIKKTVEVIRQRTGVENVFFRLQPAKRNTDTTKYIVSVQGSRQAVEALRKLLMPRSYLGFQLSKRALSFALSCQVLFKLQHLIPKEEDNYGEKWDHAMIMAGNVQVSNVRL